MTLSTFIKKAEKQIYLFKNLWKEKTTALIHGPRQTDKCSLALDVAKSITTQNRIVMYVATDSRLESQTERLAKLSNMIIFVPEFESPEDKRDYADIVIEGIEEAAKNGMSKIFIVDSVTRIAALSFGRNASVAYVMKRLVAMQMRLGISLLVISDDVSAATTRSLVSLADAIMPLPEPQHKKASDRRSDAPAVVTDKNKLTDFSQYSGSDGASMQTFVKQSGLRP